MIYRGDANCMLEMANASSVKRTSEHILRNKERIYFGMYLTTLKVKFLRKM